jgi:hypothetical protein
MPYSDTFAISASPWLVVTRVTHTSRRQNAATLKPEEICLASRPRQRAERSETVDSIMPPPSAGNPPAHAQADVYC